MYMSKDGLEPDRQWSHLIFAKLIFYPKHLFNSQFLLFCFDYVTVRSRDKTFAKFLENRYIVRPDFHIFSSIVLGFDMKIKYL